MRADLSCTIELTPKNINGGLPLSHTHIRSLIDNLNESFQLEYLYYHFSRIFASRNTDQRLWKNLDISGGWGTDFVGLAPRIIGRPIIWTGTRSNDHILFFSLFVGENKLGQWNIYILAYKQVVSEVPFIPSKHRSPFCPLIPWEPFPPLSPLGPGAPGRPGMHLHIACTFDVICWLICSRTFPNSESNCIVAGAPNENIVQNHINIALLNLL